mmetsp:Transcript_73630/g.162821  ORF Transcript_73630/g.162821 Transcript_73630/m.162821 type:complete len:271 (+) Transcript_73630:1228-2040(+)
MRNGFLHCLTILLIQLRHHFFAQLLHIDLLIVFHRLLFVHKLLLLLLLLGRRGRLQLSPSIRIAAPSPFDAGPGIGCRLSLCLGGFELGPGVIDALGSLDRGPRGRLRPGVHILASILELGSELHLRPGVDVVIEIRHRGRNIGGTLPFISGPRVLNLVLLSDGLPDLLDLSGLRLPSRIDLNREQHRVTNSQAISLLLMQEHVTAIFREGVCAIDEAETLLRIVTLHLAADQHPWDGSPCHGAAAAAPRLGQWRPARQHRRLGGRVTPQ